MQRGIAGPSASCSQKGVDLERERGGVKEGGGEEKVEVGGRDGE